MTKTLKEILNQFKAVDHDQLPDDYDPEELIGDLKGKVDSIKHKVDEWEKEAELMQEYSKEFAARAKSIINKRDRLIAYVHYQMSSNEWEKLPGEIWEIKWKLNPPRLVIDAEANASNYLHHAEFMQQKTSYNWDKNKIKAAIKAGDKFDFAKNVQDKKIVFKIKKGS
jgi:hypothetical protein